MHADLIRELTLIKLPVIFDDGPTIAKVRDLKSAKLIVATLSEPADPRPYAVVSAIVPAVRAAEEAKGLVRVHLSAGIRTVSMQTCWSRPQSSGSHRGF